jgi:two-component system response regulator YesN
VRDRTRTRLRGLVHDALVVIERDLERDIALDDVARTIATSRRSLQRAFEGEGITFREAVAVARMRRAKALLSQGGMPVYRVADRVGYRSKAEFTKAFKRYSGQTPTDYMRALRDGDVAIEARANGNGGSLNGHPS